MKQTSGLPILYARRSDGGIQTWSIEVDGCRLRTHSGIEGGAVTVSAWTECKSKGKGAAQTTPEQQAEKEARAAWTKKKDSGYKVDKADVDKDEFFAPMLAHVADDYMNLVEAALAAGKPVSLQPKLDGMRCIAQGSGLTSRNGKPILSAEHVRKYASGAACGPHAHLILDGELYAHKFRDDFNKIISLAKKSKPTAADLAKSAELLQYHVYDMPSAPGSFSTRWATLHALVGDNHPFVKLVETVRISRIADVEELFGRWRGEGYEGAMIRLEGPYEQKRSKTLLKYKKMEEEDFTIQDVLEGEGNRAGMCGSMVFKTAAGKPFNASVMGSVSVFKKMLTDRKKLIGLTASIQYQNLTPDGIPRFPYVKAVRNYE